MEKITTKKDIKLFRREIARELKNILSNVEDNLDDCWAIELLNNEDDYICHIYAKAGITTPDKRRITFDSISVENFMYNNDYDLDKYTTDVRLTMVANRIINEYNDQVDREIEYRKASKAIEAE